MNLTELHRPFPPSAVEWRVGSTNGEKTSGLALAYLTARHVMERLDEVVGPENWQTRYEFSAGTAVCYLSLRIAGEWVTKADGAGTTDVEAEKGQISDALKRAAVSWGIGRYLYNMNNVWVDIEGAGKSYRIKRDQYAKLEAALLKQFGDGSSQEAPSEPVQPLPVPAKTGLKDTAQRALWGRLVDATRKCQTWEEFNTLWDHQATMAAYDGFSPDWKREMDQEVNDKEAELRQKFGELLVTPSQAADPFGLDRLELTQAQKIAGTP